MDVSVSDISLLEDSHGIRYVLDMCCISPCLLAIYIYIYTYSFQEVQVQFFCTNAYATKNCSEAKVDISHHGKPFVQPKQQEVDDGHSSFVAVEVTAFYSYIPLM